MDDAYMAEEMKRLLLPGDEIGTTEEYISGEGTYEKDGKVYSSNTGILEIDNNEMVVKVRAVTSTPVLLEINDLVYGDVFDNKNAMSLIEVQKVAGKVRNISAGGTMGSLHISKVQDGFLKDIRDAFRVGDIVRAKVIQVSPSLQLSTTGTDLGVILAKCIDCRETLEKKGNELECPRCEKRYHKKLADDYGSVKLE